MQKTKYVFGLRSTVLPENKKSSFPTNSKARKTMVSSFKIFDPYLGYSPESVPHPEYTGIGTIVD